MLKMSIFSCSLKCCIVTTAGCKPLISAVSRCFSLRELNLKYNLFMDESLTLMCDWLSRTECKLEVLRWDLFCVFLVGQLKIWTKCFLVVVVYMTLNACILWRTTNKSNVLWWLPFTFEFLTKSEIQNKSMNN